jgi:hypothetical protein
MNLYMKPLLLWNRLAWDASQLALASNQVFHQRAGSLVNGATGKGNAGDDLTSMGQEKVEAVMESAQIAGMQLLLLNQQLMSIAIKQMMSASSALMSIAGSHSPAESMERQAKLVRATLDSSAVAASAMSTSTAKLARSVVKPVLKRVKKNGRKTGKR